MKHIKIYENIYPKFGKNDLIILKKVTIPKKWKLPQEIIEHLHNNVGIVCFVHLEDEIYYSIEYPIFSETTFSYTFEEKYIRYATKQEIAYQKIKEDSTKYNL